MTIGATLAEIAAALGMTRERVRQIEGIALGKLHRGLARKGIDLTLDELTAALVIAVNHWPKPVEFTAADKAHGGRTRRPCVYCGEPRRNGRVTCKAHRMGVGA